MEPLASAFISFIGGGGLVALIAWLRFRSKDRAETTKIDTESESLTALTIKTFQGIYQDLIRDQMVRISRLEEEQAASGTRIISLERLVEEQNKLITSLRKEIVQLKEQLVAAGHVPGATKETNDE